jgi:lipopolysaccharide biosynthesis glycosyltransferase
MTRERRSQEDETSFEILFCANPDYYQHAAVAAVSLAENNRQFRANIHVLTCAEDAIAEGMLRNSLVAYRHINLVFHHVSDDRLNDVFIDRHLTKETYMRFLAPEFFPASVSRVLYLDCDLVVLDELKSLWDMDLRGKAIAAAPDFPWDQSGTLPSRLASLELGAGHTYVNCGVLLLDLDHWRRNRVSDRLFAYAKERGSALAFHDQDTINAVLRDDVHVLDCRWNLQARMYMLGHRSFPNEFAATRDARQRPAILHYTTADKPWLFRSLAARKRLYFQYLDKTAWRTIPPALPTAWQRTEWQFGRQLLRIGIDYMRIASLVHHFASKPYRLVRLGLAGAREITPLKLARLWRGTL